MANQVASVRALIEAGTNLNLQDQVRGLPVLPCTEVEYCT
jgi:hypothetical protein